VAEEAESDEVENEPESKRSLSSKRASGSEAGGAGGRVGAEAGDAVAGAVYEGGCPKGVRDDG
jgi:hypothetical protein